MWGKKHLFWALNRLFHSAIMEGILIISRSNMPDVASDSFFKLQTPAKFCHSVSETEKVLIRFHQQCSISCIHANYYRPARISIRWELVQKFRYEDWLCCMGFCATAGINRACLEMFSAGFLSVFVYFAKLLEGFFLFIFPNGLHRSFGKWEHYMN